MCFCDSKLGNLKAQPTAFWVTTAYPLIGREKEISQLMALWQRVSSKGSGMSVTLLGSKGSGRHRLLEELRKGVLRSGGAVVRHSLEAESGQPTLIINYSHKGRLGSDPEQPWLSVNFAETGPVPDQHIIELKALSEGDSLRLAEAYVAGAVGPELQEKLFSLGPKLPAELLQQLDQWGEAGALIPGQGRWRLGEVLEGDDESPRKREKAKKKSVSLVLDYKEALNTIVELWSTSLEQDDPMVSALQSFCKALKCERADLYQVIDGQAKYVCASSFGRHRLDQTLTSEIMVTAEPVSSGSSLLYPLRCGTTFCGFISFQWWAAAVPSIDAELFHLISTAASPIALTLGQTQLEDRRLGRISVALEEILQATSEPADILTRLTDSLRKCLEFDVLSAWIAREGQIRTTLQRPERGDGTRWFRLRRPTFSRTLRNSAKANR